MIDKKTRIALRSLASTIKPVVWVGKDGFTDSVVNQVGEELFNHELVKIALQENAPEIDDTELNSICTKLNCDIVTRIGKKIVLYKKSDKKNIKHII